MRTKNIERSVLVARMGISHSTVSLWFSRDRSPHSIEVYERIAEILGVHAAWLMFGVVVDISDEENRVIREMRRSQTIRQKLTEAAGIYFRRKDAF